MRELPDYARRCCTRLRDAGYKAYPVGGCVRDLLLGRVPEDWDVATSARPEQVLALFDHTAPTGLKHGTVTVLLKGGHIEVTTFRREGEYADGRHPDTVSFDTGLEEDLARRDFTINAMALGVDGSIIDPFGGQIDIMHRQIRCVGNPVLRFCEDALRMLRAVRFSAQLGFDIDAAAAAAITACAEQIAHVSVERVRAELEKIITASYPERGNLLFSMGLLSPWMAQSVFPDLGRLSVLPPQPLSRWSGLCALLGGTDLLGKLKPDRHTAAVCTGVLAALHAPPPRSDADWRRSLALCGVEVMAIAASVMGTASELEQVLTAKPCYEISRLALTGGDLQAIGLKGAEIGAAQKMLLDHVLEHPEDNNKETLGGLVKADQVFSNSVSKRS